jgi:RNA polymerase sigma-70 factor (ECF subfamily)
MNGDDDVTLVRRCTEGDDGAFGTLVDRYQTRIFNAILRVVRNYDDARDVTQTVFVKTFENLRRYDPAYKFFSWIYRIAMNESLNFVALKGRHDRVMDGAVPPGVASDSDVHREAVANRDLDEALGRLKPEHRSVIVLKHILGCSYREMSVILELPQRTVKSRLYSARESLRKLLTGETPRHERSG